MAQKKGQTGNPNGRPKGTPNKSSKELREAINNLVSNNIDTLQSDIDNLEPKDRLAFIEKLFKYVIPPSKEEPIQVDNPQSSYHELMYNMFIESKKITEDYKKRQVELNSKNN